jgi:triphosphatase
LDGKSWCLEGATSKIPQGKGRGLVEIELKLAANPNDIPALRRALETSGNGSGASASSVTSTYYDTPDLRLWQHHLTLRVRHQGRQHLQTLKADDRMSVDLLARAEWQDIIDSDHPNLNAPNSGRRLTKMIGESDLRPLFVTIVRRTVLELEFASLTRIEAAIDEGEIRAVEREAAVPLSEVELELESGDPAAIYDVALQLLDIVPLRIETRSKAERGYELIVADAKAPPMKVKPVTLAAGMTVEEALQRVGRRCVAHLLRNEPAVLASQSEGIHQMRVAVRRLRSVLSDLKPMLSNEHYRWVSEELKCIARLLGSARDWDVLVADLLEPVERALPLERDLKQLAQAAAQRRQEVYDRAKQVILSTEHTATMLKLARWFDARGWRDQPLSAGAALLLACISDVAPAAIDRRWRQSRKRSRRFKELTPEQRHRLRIALKKLRYTIEFLQSLFDESAVKAFIKILRSLQDDLGRINDLRTAHGLLTEVTSCTDQHDNAVARAGGIVLGWHERGVTELESNLRKYAYRLRRATPFWPRRRVVQIGPCSASGQTWKKSL